MSVVLPEPVWPMSAIVFPASMSRSMPCEDGPSGHVLEGHLLEADTTGAWPQTCRAGTVGHVLRLVHHLEDALAGRGRALRLADPHTERSQRHDEHPEVEEDRAEASRRQVAASDHARADEQHCCLREERDERHERHVRRALPVRAQRLVEDELGASRELLQLGGLLRERLHDVDADDVLLGDGRDVGEPLLHVAERRMRDVAVAVGEHHERRRDRERDERELPLEEEEDDGHRHDGEHVLEEEDEAVAEEEAHALQVDRRARHELARLVTVVEAERQPHELRVDAAAHVHLDVERLLAGEEATSGHERRADDAERDDLADRQPEPVPVVVDERVVDDVAARKPDECDLGGLRTDREDDRDGDAEAVWTEEAEQPDEGRSVRNGAHLLNVDA